MQLEESVVHDTTTSDSKAPSSLNSVVRELDKTHDCITKAITGPGFITSLKRTS